MSVDTNLERPKTHNEHQKAIVNLISTHNAIVNEMNEFFKRFDITRQQYNVLRILEVEYPKALPVHKIREQLIDKMSDASRIVERLRLKGLIQRTVSNHDKRAVQVTLTDKGIDLVYSIDSDMDNLEQAIQNLSPEEVIVLNGLLDKINSNNRIINF